MELDSLKLLIRKTTAFYFLHLSIQTRWLVYSCVIDKLEGID